MKQLPQPDVIAQSVKSPLVKISCRQARAGIIRHVPSPSEKRAGRFLFVEQVAAPATLKPAADIDFPPSVRADKFHDK